MTATLSDFDHVTRHFDNVRKNGSGFSARCPAHDDDENSLTGDIGDKDNLVVCCHAKCEFGAIVDALGLKQSDFFLNGSHRKGKPKAVDIEYTYRNAENRILCQVVRLGGKKKIRQRRPDGNGGWIWDMKGVDKALYRLPELLSKPDDSVFIVAGEKDCDNLREKFGFTATTNIGGAGKWLKKYNDSLKGRKIVILPDNDDAGRKHADDIATQLVDVAKWVRVVTLPNLPDKGDVSDWIPAGGTKEELIELVKQAPQWAVESGAKSSETRAENSEVLNEFTKQLDKTQPDEGDKDPHRLAKMCEEKLPVTRRWRKEWHEYDGRRYLRVSDEDFDARVTAIVKEDLDARVLNPWKANERRKMQKAIETANKNNKPVQMPKQSDPPKAVEVDTKLVGNVVHAFKSRNLIAATVEQPCALNDLPQRNYVSFQNGLLDIDAAVSGTVVALMPHTPSWFSPVCLPYPYDPNAKCPRWMAFLERNLEKDGERINLLQEWFGYNTVFDTSQHAFLIMFGEGANGKSVACSALQTLLGVENISFVSLVMFQDKFQLNSMRGKLANVSTEIDQVNKYAEGVLKAIVAGETLPHERKFKDPISYPATARLTFSCNSLPRFSDRSEGVWRRLITMPFNVQIPEAEKNKAMVKSEYWLDEAPGLFNWALEGLRRLRRQKRFTESEVCRTEHERFKLECNPCREFLLERYTKDEDGRLLKDDVYGSYSKWCKDNGHQPLGHSQFAKEVKRVLGAEPKRMRFTKSTRRQYFVGISKRVD